MKLGKLSAHHEVPRVKCKGGRLYESQKEASMMQTNTTMCDVIRD